MRKKVTILGINGGFGQVFSKLLNNEGQFDITGIDLSDEVAQSSECGVYAPSDLTLKTTATGLIIAKSDIIIICLPEEVAYKFMELYGQQIARNALLIDTLSVKNKIASIYIQNDINALSLNPMFGPDLNMEGKNIIVVKFKDSPGSDLFVSLLEAWKLKLVFLTAEEHDKTTSLIQVATHAAIIAFGATLKDADIAVADLLKVATPPFLAIGALYSRIASGKSNVYWNIQKENIYAAGVRKTLLNNLAKLDNSVDENREEDFTTLITPGPAEQEEAFKELSGYFAALFKKDS